MVRLFFLLNKVDYLAKGTEAAVQFLRVVLKEQVAYVTTRRSSA